jgi:hypothetical protein
MEGLFSQLSFEEAFTAGSHRNDSGEESSSLHSSILN